MKRFLIAAALALGAFSAHALQPYLAADKVAGSDLKSALGAVEQKLVAAGFTVIGRHTPAGIAGGSLVVTDASLVDACTAIGGSAVTGIPIRVGVKADGTVSSVNLEFWERAFLRKDYAKAEPAVKAVAEKLAKALGAGAPFGGEIAVEELPEYHYMIGMERFEALRNDLARYPSFDAAVQTVRDNLAKGVKRTAKVYELVYPERKIAVFGVAMNDPEDGEGWWVNKIGADHLAALPWEIFIVDGKVMSLYGRYRTALAWPSLSMGQFMRIARHPDTTMEMMQAVAGAKKEGP